MYKSKYVKYECTLNISAQSMPITTIKAPADAYRYLFFSKEVERDGNMFLVKLSVSGN